MLNMAVTFQVDLVFMEVFIREWKHSTPLHPQLFRTGPSQSTGCKASTSQPRQTLEVTSHATLQLPAIIEITDDVQIIHPRDQRWLLQAELCAQDYSETLNYHE